MTASTTVLQPSTFAFSVIGVGDLVAAVDFFTRGASLTLGRTDVGHGRAALETADGQVSLVLDASSPRGLQRLVYAAQDIETMNSLSDRLTRAGVEVARGAVGGMTDDALLFEDPDGYPLALVVLDPTRPSSGSGDEATDDTAALVVVKEILHPLIQVRDLRRSVSFYRDVLGFQTSDLVADVTAFLRCADTFHHSLAITVARAEIELDHICFHLPDLDALMRARNRLRRRFGVECTETFRHGGSESITFYFRDPNSGVQIEFCAEHRKITDADHEPRVLPAAATTFDMWERIDDDDPGI